MTVCSAINCSYKHSRKKIPGKSVHRFPFGRPDLLKKWIQNMWRKDWAPSRNSILCSDHFEPECFDRTGARVRLHRDAVPTIFNFPQHFQKELDSLKAEFKTPYPLSVNQEPFEVISSDTDIQTALFGGSDKNRILIVPSDLDIIPTFNSSNGNTNDQNQVLIIPDDTNIQTILNNEDMNDSDDNRAIIVSDGTNVKRIEKLELKMVKLKKQLKTLHQTSRKYKMKITRLRKKVSKIIGASQLIPCSPQPIVHLIACDH